jgi:hypothetical protein
MTHILGGVRCSCAAVQSDSRCRSDRASGGDVAAAPLDAGNAIHPGPTSATYALRAPNRFKSAITVHRPHSIRLVCGDEVHRQHRSLAASRYAAPAGLRHPGAVRVKIASAKEWCPRSQATVAPGRTARTGAGSRRPWSGLRGRSRSYWRQEWRRPGRALGTASRSAGRTPSQ